MKREQIIKDLECCKFGKDEAKCKECNWHPWIKPRCWRLLASNTLSLIKELAEENEYLKQQNEIYEVLNKKLEDACDSYAWTYGTAVSKELFLKKERESTVQKIQTMFAERLDISVCGYSTEEVVSDVLETLDRVAKELLEENK